MKITESSYPGLEKLTSIKIFYALGEKYLKWLTPQIDLKTYFRRSKEIIIFWIQHRN
jgi:hypothetical protein